MSEASEIFKILPIRPNFDLKQVKKKRKEVLFKYHPNCVYSVKPEQLQKKLFEEYNEVSSLINSTYIKIENNTNIYKSREDYDKYKRDYKLKYLNTLNESDFIIILEANNLKTTGSVEQLKDRIIKNVPERIAQLNLKESYLREKYAPKIDDILKEFPENKLVRILELKNIPAKGDSVSLIKQIVSSISEDEINNLIDQVDQEINDLRAKLKKLNEKHLKLILDNNHLNSYGTKNQLITKIIDTFPINEIEDNIHKVTINKQKALKKLYSITGQDDISESFKKTLSTNNLEIEQGIEIKNRLIALINKYQLEEKDIELKLNEFINKKVQQIINDTLKELYKITGEKSINAKFFNRLKKAGLKEKDGIQIKNEIIDEIKAGKIQKDNLKHLINLKIQEKKIKLENEKIKILYDITGETTLSSSFKKLLSEHNLDEQDGLKIQNEIITLIKTTHIDKNEINPKLLKLITLTSSEKLINTCNLSYLNQIALINNLSQCNTRQEYVEYFLENISSSFNDLKIKSDIIEINNIKEKLAKLYKNQVEFILISNDISCKGTKKELINIILSKFNIVHIKLIISEINNVNKELNQLTMNELSFILNENNIKVGGTKTKVINEITKKLLINTIKKNIKQLNEIKTQLNELTLNELKFIAKSNNISLCNDKYLLITEIETKVPFVIISANIVELSNIKNIVKSYNKAQRQHILITNGLNTAGDDKTQINNILENIDFFEIIEINKMIDDLKEELNNLSVNQLNHILDKHNLEKSTDKSIQIDVILNNILIPFIKKDIQTIKSFENKINEFSEDEIDCIISENKLRRSIDKEKNIKTIFENLSFDEIKNYLSKNQNNEISIDEIKDSMLICPIKVSKGRKILTTEKRENSIFLLLFDDGKLFNEYKKKNKSVKKFEKDLYYFKKLINKNKKIEGIIVRKTPKDMIFKKNQLN